VARSEAAVLLSLAESIADGAAIDWTAAEAQASPDDQAIVRQLRILADLAVLHRSLPGGSEPAPSLAPSREGLDVPATGSWAHLSLIERLGGGTFGEVYRAWDRHLQREVALKLLRAGESIDDLDASRITHEGRLLARVRHPNVITVYGVAAHDNRVGLWMELVRGVTLERQIVEHGPLSAHEATLVGLDLCRALAAIHAAGLIHRDVKAQNVMREAGGRIVLMDLGTGREAGALGRGETPDLAGTPLYLAPELFTGALASERTDLYSLGVLLYHLVTGAFPVRATTIRELHEGHKKGVSVRLRDARADLPTSFVRVVERAIATDPEQRYATAGEFEADLAQALNHFTASDALRTATARSSATPAVERWRGSRRIWPRLAFAATVLVVLALLAIPWSSIRRPAPTPVRSIAVLPLVNLSGDVSHDYLADGMTDLLIADLAKIRALRVISRTSVTQFKGTKPALTDVARSLNVDAVLEGSVQRIGDRVRIYADLVHVATGRHLWAESYERDVRDVLALQNEVAQMIARGVSIELTPLEQAGFATATAPGRVNAAAQEAYLQGRYYWNKRTPEGLQKALEYFRQAAATDPSFALAYAGQADAYDLLPGDIAPATAYPLAKAAASRALELDPTLAEAHTSLAFARFIFDRDYGGAEAAFKRAIQFNPSYSTARHWYGEYLSAMGRFEEAFRQMEQAKAVDPFSGSIRSSLGSALCFAHRYEDAVEEFRSALALDPGNPSTYWELAACHEASGHLAAAAAETRRGLQVAPRYGFLLAESGRLAALNGDLAGARRIVAEMTARSSDSVIRAEAIGLVHAALRDNDRAFEFLNRAERERSPSLLWAKVDPILDSLRNDPRFPDLLRRLRLVE
jgi:serine/threonine-protein kinase